MNTVDVLLENQVDREKEISGLRERVRDLEAALASRSQRAEAAMELAEACDARAYGMGTQASVDGCLKAYRAACAAEAAEKGKPS